MTTDTKDAPTEKAVAKHAGERTTGGMLTRLEPKSFGELEHIAQVLGKSDIVPKELMGKPANILLVLMFGNEIGLSAAQALQNVMIVNGRPSLWGDATMGLVLASPVYEDSKDSFDEKTMTATFAAKRQGKDWVVRTFSQADAERAGLWKKAGPWTQYPKVMLFNRARAFALRHAFADVLKGIRVFEEERDVITLERGPEKEYAMPGEKKEAAAPADKQPEGSVVAFKVASVATTDFEGNPDCFVIKDAAEPVNKYFTDREDYAKLAKGAKEAGAEVGAIYVEKPSGKNNVRWLLALQLKA